jgi:NAD dependent epimerase/dehydratase
MRATNQTVLVTGAGGFIGSHLTECLVRQGYQVRAFVHYNSSNSWGWLDKCDTDVKGHFQVFSGDIRDPQAVNEAMKNCDAVLHLAALVAIPYSYHSPRSYVDTNITGTLNVLQAARDYGVGRVIHTSTSEVYGSATFVPINESHPQQGQSPYSASKIAADQMAFAFYSSFGLPVVTIRPFNTYGPRQSARAVIPAIITQILDGSRNIRLGTLVPTRDFSFVQDTVDGFISILKSEMGLGEVFNLGSGFEISIRETVDLISSLMQKPVEVTEDGHRVRPNLSEVQRLWADNQKARTVFNWQPKYSHIDGFKQGLMQTLEWFQIASNRDSYKAEIYNL